MTIEQVLHFFDQHNTAIIEGLIAAIILLGLFLGYRGIFSKKSISSDLGAGGGVDAAQLEKTLQKILDNQSAGARPGKAHAEESLEVAFDEGDAGTEPQEPATKATGAPQESPAEVAQLRLTLNESQKKIEILQAQLTVAETKASENAAAAEAASAAPAAGGNNAEMEAQLRDLEARLAEYEIISEDIADLSRFREENEKLKAELEVAKAGGGSAPASAPAGGEEVGEVVQAEAAPAATPEPEPIPEPTPAPEVTPEPEPVVQESAAPVQEAGSELIDDDLMKEFAAAVEGQKALDKVADKAGDGKAAAESKDENNQLMNEFENFVSKKS
ncbi:MAG: hypothetical protein J7501_10080 [Bdellovibrio sp.]|nr:hypothetical protein [Bdellovibrio sp.]